jgi:hypothetical protein
MNYNSVYKCYSGKTLYWLPSDKEEWYQFNISNNYQKLQDYNWINANITYQFNSLGFRSEEFIEKGIMFLGCSHTCGIGLPMNNIWTSIVAKELQLPQCNFGQGGTSSDTAFRMCLGYIEKIKPKIVIYCEPPGTRFEIVNDDKIFSVTIDNDSLKVFNTWSKDDNNIFFSLRKNYYAIKWLCHERDIKFVHHIAKFDYVDLARDLIHPGIQSNVHFARQVLNLIE